ncbi:MAG: hypothetical protein DRJ10_16505, partial [Bacteroidetes bacterium]
MYKKQIIKQLRNPEHLNLRQKFYYMYKINIVIFILLFSIAIKAQDLLSNEQLDTCQVYSSVEEALLTPDNVFVLDLSANSLIELPKNIIKLTKLQRLNLSNNSITKLPEEFFELKLLQELNLEENRLTKLSSAVSNFVHLKKINLTRTKIPSIPESFSELINLEELNLSWNDLKADSILAIFQLNQLEDLNLMRNQLDTLNDKICNFKNLLYLNLNFNPLQKLPEQFGNLN